MGRSVALVILFVALFTAWCLFGYVECRNTPFNPLHTVLVFDAQRVKRPEAVDKSKDNEADDEMEGIGLTMNAVFAAIKSVHHTLSGYVAAEC